MKKLLAILLSVLMLTGIFAVVGLAANADNNAIFGVRPEYANTRTVEFAAIGDGSDNDSPAEGDTRYIPVSWSVNDDLKGTFNAADPVTRYTHKKYGDYTLTVVFQEESYTDGAWTATGNTDEKTADYTVDPTDEELKEDVFPNKLVYFIFGVLYELINKIASLIKS